MRHTLVLQWLASTKSDFETLIEMEDALETGLGQAGSVDGHDVGSAEMNIFIETAQPLEAFAVAKAILGNRPTWTDVRAAYRGADGEAYMVLWPPGLVDFRVT